MEDALLPILRVALDRYDLPAPLEIEPGPAPSVNNVSVRLRAGDHALRCKLYNGAHDLAALRYEQALLTALDRAALGTLHVALAALPPTPRPGHALFQEFFRFPPPERDPLQLTLSRLGAEDSAEADELLAWWRGEAGQLAAFVDGPYRQLPHQLCHNDPAPYNVLTSGDTVTAVIDFEFACPAPRGLDIAMALRMTMRVWEQDNPWPSAEAFCRGYRRSAQLSTAEAAQLPSLIRLRSAMGILWALGRGALVDPQRLLEHVGYLRNAVRWLDHNGAWLATFAIRYLAEEGGS